MAAEKVEISPDILRGLAQIQCTLAEAASVLGCSERTLKRRLKEDEQLRLAWASGKGGGRVSLRRRMWKSSEVLTTSEGVPINDRSAVQMQIHLSKHWLGMADKHEITGRNGAAIKTEAKVEQTSRVRLYLPDNGRGDGPGGEVGPAPGQHGEEPPQQEGAPPASSSDSGDADGAA